MRRLPFCFFGCLIVAEVKIYTGEAYYDLYRISTNQSEKMQLKMYTLALGFLYCGKIKNPYNVGAVRVLKML